MNVPLSVRHDAEKKYQEVTLVDKLGAEEIRWLVVLTVANFPRLQNRHNYSLSPDL
jgi:hypothetical protein